MKTLSGVRAVLFDLDGTLVDTLGDLAASVNFALERLGRPARTLDEIKNFIGEGVRQLLRDALGPSHEGLTDQALALFTPHYLEHVVDRSALYPGVKDTLARLAPGRKLAVVTNKPVIPSRKILSALGVLDCFEALVGGDTLPVKKPDPAPVREACRLLGVDPSEAVLVGDSTGDIRSAHGAGAKVLAAAFGYRPAAELSAADGLIHRFSDVLTFLEDRA
jgi:phosphoglycolate phosphatase